MSVDDRFWNLIEEQRRITELDRAREDLMQAAMLTGEECHIFGRRVRIRLEWIDEPPMTDEQLREMGEKMKTSAQARSEKAAR